MKLTKERIKALGDLIKSHYPEFGTITRDQFEKRWMDKFEFPYVANSQGIFPRCDSYGYFPPEIIGGCPKFVSTTACCGMRRIEDPAVKLKGSYYDEKTGSYKNFSLEADTVELPNIQYARWDDPVSKAALILWINDNESQLKIGSLIASTASGSDTDWATFELAIIEAGFVPVHRSRNPNTNKFVTLWKNEFTPNVLENMPMYHHKFGKAKEPAPVQAQPLPQAATIKAPVRTSRFNHL